MGCWVSFSALPYFETERVKQQNIQNLIHRYKTQISASQVRQRLLEANFAEASHVLEQYKQQKHVSGSMRDQQAQKVQTFHDQTLLEKKTGLLLQKSLQQFLTTMRFSEIKNVTQDAQSMVKGRQADDITGFEDLADADYVHQQLQELTEQYLEPNSLENLRGEEAPLLHSSHEVRKPTSQTSSSLTRTPREHVRTKGELLS